MSTNLTSKITHADALVLIPDDDIRAKEAKNVHGGDGEHPATKYLYESMEDNYIGGKLEAIDRLMHYDYVALRCTQTQSLQISRHHSNSSQTRQRSFVFTSTSLVGHASLLSRRGKFYPQ